MIQRNNWCLSIKKFSLTSVLRKRGASFKANNKLTIKIKIVTKTFPNCLVFHSVFLQDSLNLHTMVEWQLRKPNCETGQSCLRAAGGCTAGWWKWVQFSNKSFKLRSVWEVIFVFRSPGEWKKLSVIVVWSLCSFTFMRSWFYWCFWYIETSDYPLCWKNISFIRFVTILEVFTVLCHSFSPVSSFPANYVRKREENNYQKAGTCKLGIERRSSDPVACEQSFYHNFACLWALAQCLEWKSSRVLCRKQRFASPAFLEILMSTKKC